MMLEFQIRHCSEKRYQFVLRSKEDGKTVLSGRQYTTKNGCREEIDFVRNNAPYDYRYEKKRSPSSAYYFNLKAADGQVIGTSEMYATAANRDNGIDFVKAQATRAFITDLTGPRSGN